jgi:hypothetical protein
MQLPALNLPKANLKLSKKGKQVYVWCITRKKELMLTPEEWVRQHVIHFLINTKKVPSGLIASEQNISIHQLNRRCDIIVYGKNQIPKLLVECKAVNVILDTKSLHQIAHYNSQLNVDLLWITNGLTHVLYRIDRVKKTLNIIDELPNFEDL